MKIILILLFSINLFAQYGGDAKFSGFIYPEDYAKNNTADWTEVLKTAMLDARDFNKQLVLSAKYDVSDIIDIDLERKNINILAINNATINSTAVYDTNLYRNPRAALHFYNGTNVNIQGLNFTGLNHDIYSVTWTGQNPATHPYSYFNNILFTFCDSIYLENVTSRYADYAGVQVVNSKKLTMINCNMERNSYVGVLVRGTLSGLISGGSYSYNGNIPKIVGYGISISGRFQYPYGTGDVIDNQQFTITGVTANYNMRKGIDSHGCISLVIQNNHVKGWATDAIYAVNEGGETNFEKVNKEIIIDNNICIQDTTWYFSLTEDRIPDALKPQYCGGIAIGTYGAAVKGGGVHKVTNNILRDMTGNSTTHIVRYGINAFQQASGEAQDAMIVRGNQIINCRAYYGAIMMYDGSATIIPKFTEVSDNIISGGSFPIGIYIDKGNSLTIQNNDLEGTFSDNPITYTHTATKLEKYGNRLNGELLPNEYYTSGDGNLLYDKTTYNKGGEYLATCETSASTVNVEPVFIDASEYESGGITANIEITVNRFGVTYSGIYRAVASAGNNSGTISTNVSHLTSEGTGNPQTYKPAITWESNDTERTLNIALNSAYTSYVVKVKYTSWRIMPK
jgi:hypothetical protein